MIRKLLLAILLLAPMGFYPILHTTPTEPIDNPKGPSPQEVVTPDQHLAMGYLAGASPWEAMRNFGQQDRTLEDLAKKDPVAFLEQALARAEKDVHGYRCIFDKQERVNGKMRPRESIRCHFRVEPFSVHMEWLKGKDRAFRTLYVKGENDDLLIVRILFAFGPMMHKKVDAPDVMATSRFPITRFGMHLGAKDTLEHMQAAQKQGTLHVRYEGMERVKELGGRLCYKFIRTPYNPPEEIEKVNELTTYIDAVTLLQTGSILKDTDGKLVAEYFFRDIVVNPTFDAKQFTMDSL